MMRMENTYKLPCPKCGKIWVLKVVEYDMIIYVHSYSERKIERKGAAPITTIEPLECCELTREEDLRLIYSSTNATGIKVEDSQIEHLHPEGPECSKPS